MPKKEARFGRALLNPCGVYGQIAVYGDRDGIKLTLIQAANYNVL